MKNTPDKWVVIKIGTEEPIYKVFATWYGGYLDGDSWKMNSGIKGVDISNETFSGDFSGFFIFHGYSGSAYKCHYKAYGTSSYTQGVLDSIIKKAKEAYPDKPIEVLPEDTDWINLLT